LKPTRIESVAAFYQKRHWPGTNEDHTQAILRFASGETADIVISTLAAAPREKYRVLGTRGAIAYDWDAADLRIYRPREGGSPTVDRIPLKPAQNHFFYESVAAHILEGKPLAVTPEQARRNVAVLEAAEESAESGQPVTPRHEENYET
ncbi:MAG: hypothetical protein JO317_01980, partial [Verrucomicrobiae bacterium]|nr:hypothetical protein [Verrucomicrobiae bacterium]